VTDARQCRVLDCEAALNAWNLARDVARSTATSWSDRGQIADDCHAKLTIAGVPWLAGLDAYAPRWSVTQERYLRRRLGAAFTVLGAQLPAPGRGRSSPRGAGRRAVTGG